MKKFAVGASLMGVGIGLGVGLISGIVIGFGAGVLTNRKTGGNK